MAINPVPAHYPGFIFDGENSRNYGVYITGVDIYGAPERDTELVTIPGRNGDYNLDRGRWKNIKITYECAMGADTEADFLTGIDAFRNMLASRIGYKRLEDEINTGEYRQAVFADGFDVDYIDPKAAAFSVVFECKPQRFLTTGETAQAVTSGGTVTNPTAYEANPQLQVWGYGEIDINGQPLEIISGPIGKTMVSGTLYGGTGASFSFNFDDTFCNVGDSLTFDKINFSVSVIPGNDTISHATVSDTAGWNPGIYTGTVAEIWAIVNPVYSYGTPGADTNTVTATIFREGIQAPVSVTVVWGVSYDGAKTITLSQAITLPTGYTIYKQNNTHFYIVHPMYVDSSQSALGSPIYFDLDIGEAWKEEGGEIVSVNNAVTIPAKLPTLSPGANTITFDNTITQFKIVPRWWKL